MDNQDYSEFWLANNANSYDNKNKPWHKDRIDAVVNAIPENVSVVDLACGNGEITNHIYTRRNPSRIVGYELGQKAVDYCSINYPSIDYFQGDVLDMPFKKDEFEWAHAGEVIEHLGNPEQLIKVYRILSARGRLSLPLPFLWMIRNI